MQVGNRNDQEDRMPDFHEMVRVRERPGIPAWQDIMAMEGHAQAEAVKLAANAVWSWMHAQTEKDARHYTKASITYRGGLDRPAWYDGNADTDPAAIVTGFRWDGIISNEWGAFVTLWPSLAGKITARHSEDPEIRLANSFRSKVSRLLRYSRNVVCVHQGGGHDADGGFKYPQWFVSDDYNDTPVVIPKRKLQGRGLTGNQAAQIAAAERRLTPEQAGEDRQPEPVTTLAPCRSPGCKMRWTQNTLGNRKQHEIAMHPELIPEYYPLDCQVRGCHDKFGSAKAMGIHLGTKGHGITDQGKRALLIEKALDKATGTPEAKPQHKAVQPEVQQPEPEPAAPAEASAPEEAKPAELKREPARLLTRDEVIAQLDAATILEIWIGNYRSMESKLDEIAGKFAALAAENERLRAEARQVSDDARLAGEMRKLFAKQGR